MKVERIQLLKMNKTRKNEKEEMKLKGYQEEMEGKDEKRKEKLERKQLRK